MRKLPYRQSLFAGAAALAIVGNALAMDASATGKDAKTAAQDRQAAAQQTAQDKRDTAHARSDDAQLKACQKRETAIKNLMARISSRGERHLDVFNQIADRTQAFYTAKGKTLSNYDALVADVNAKKAAAQAAVDTVKSSSISFKCDGSDPKGQVASFKDGLKSEVAALKAYKTAVKN